ncbi:hypothetical protein NBRC116601_20320 [Cognatishimia sp. WU-CL00825]|uniref:ferredoxin n=1 Tax=Cognatishimia sp. WU-CL00825 TaxID=3127658 RepID=UPI00310B038C
MIAQLLHDNRLTVVGGFHPHDDPWVDGFQTVLMIGPDEPGFWGHFTQQPEYLDGRPNALDRFGKRILNAIAKTESATAFFPSDGPPYAPFIQWALQSGCDQSPVGLLVHPKAGLFASFRGALALRRHIALPAALPAPCGSCHHKPCLTACPVGALTAKGYDVAACQSYIKSPQGRDCMTGCKVRISCPTSQKFGRVPAQSEFHMKAFLGE